MYDPEDDVPTTFISPPFSVLFLTTAKVIISAILILAAIGLIALVAILVAGDAWLSFRN